MLTKKQAILLTYLDTAFNEHGVCPSFDEMKDALGLKSKSGIHRLISGLEERGYIRRLPNRARALEILKRPDAVDNDMSKSDTPHPAAIGMVSLPLYGRIAAGTPIEAIRHEGTHLDIPESMIKSGDDYYALEVTGDSMINAGIHDGDNVIIKRTQIARDGDIVVALVHNEEVTLKTFATHQNQIVLKAANPDYPDRMFPASDVQVQGTLVSLLRNYD